MATIAKNQSAFPTLTANTADTVTIGTRSGQLFIAPFFKRYAIVNRTGTSEIFFTFADASEGATLVTATVTGDGCFFLPAVIGASEIVSFSPSERLGIQFSVISSGAMAYAIIGLNG